MLFSRMFRNGGAKMALVFILVLWLIALSSAAAVYFGLWWLWLPLVLLTVWAVMQFVVKLFYVSTIGEKNASRLTE